MGNAQPISVAERPTHALSSAHAAHVTYAGPLLHSLLWLLLEELCL